MTALLSGCGYNLGRMEKLDDSDWYFNRSLLNLLMGTAYLHEYIGKRKRDHHYYAATVLRFLSQWSALINRRRVLSLEDRGLLPTQLSVDQHMMLEVRNMSAHTVMPPAMSAKMRRVSVTVSTASNSGSLSSWLSLL